MNILRISLIPLAIANMLLPYFPPLRFMISITLIQLALVANYKSIIDPRLMIFSFYFLWYGLLMLLNSNTYDFDFTAPKALMLYWSYFVNYFMLTFGASLIIRGVEPKTRCFVFNKTYSKYILFSIFITTLLLLMIYIGKIGSISDFVFNAHEVHFQLSEGLGWLVAPYRMLTFTLAVILGLLHYKTRSVFCLVVVIVFLISFPMITGKSPFIQLLLYMFSYKLISLSLRKALPFLSVLIPVIVLFFMVSLALRTEIYDINELGQKSGSYNDTFFDAYNAVTKLEPGEIITVLAPVNRLIFTFMGGNPELRWLIGYSLGEILTLELYPGVYTVQHGTAEFGWEVESYLNFALWPGMILVFAIGCLFGFVYKKACIGGPEWVALNAFIFVNMFSVLRGGIFSWYIILLSGTAGLIFYSTRSVLKSVNAVLPCDTVANRV